MEPKEKKKRKASYRKRRTPSIPTDLIIEIISRLPEKSVARFSCVSKLWSSITSDPSFPRLRPCLLLCFQKDDDLFVSSIPHHIQNSNSSYSSSLSFDHHHMTKLPLNFGRYQSTESVHGLICFLLEEPIVWNPSTRQFLTLPTIPGKHWNNVKLFLGYDPTERKHKVVCIRNGRPYDVCGVFTLGSVQESWRAVNINHRHRSTTDTDGRCINGVIYYLAFSCQNPGFVVMSFDVRSEKFNMIKLPSGLDRNFLSTYKGRLACFHENDHRTFWILEDAQEQKWLIHDFLSPFGDYNLRMDVGFDLRGFSHAGELIYSTKNFSQSKDILLCDPVRNSWKRFELKGRLDTMYALHAFPNHIDSQMSL